MGIKLGADCLSFFQTPPYYVLLVLKKRRYSQYKLLKVFFQVHTFVVH